MTTQTRTITARGPVERMGSQFNLLEYDDQRYLAELADAGVETIANWNGERPLRVTINRREWVDQLSPGDVVEYVLEPVRRKCKDSPSGFKVGTRGIAMRIISRAGR